MAAVGGNSRNGARALRTYRVQVTGTRNVLVQSFTAVARSGQTWKQFLRCSGAKLLCPEDKMFVRTWQKGKVHMNKGPTMDRTAEMHEKVDSLLAQYPADKMQIYSVMLCKKQETVSNDPGEGKSKSSRVNAGQHPYREADLQQGPSFQISGGSSIPVARQPNITVPIFSSPQPSTSTSRQWGAPLLAEELARMGISASGSPSLSDARKQPPIQQVPMGPPPAPGPSGGIFKRPANPAPRATAVKRAYPFSGSAGGDQNDPKPSTSFQAQARVNVNPLEIGGSRRTSLPPKTVKGVEGLEEDDGLDCISLCTSVGAEEADLETKGITIEDLKPQLFEGLKLCSDLFLYGVQAEIQRLRQNGLWDRNIARSPLASWFLQEVFDKREN